MKKAIVLIISIVAIFGIFAGCNEKNENSNNNNNENPNENLDLGEFSIFNYPPIDLERIEYIVPLGQMSGAHVTPVDHQYYIPFDRNSLETCVYSPGDGIITNINHMNGSPDSSNPEDDFRILINHSENVASIYIHIDNLSEKLAAYDPGLGNQMDTNIRVEAGEILGRCNGIDYTLVDTNVTLPFVNPTSYNIEEWKLHCVDPFDYFNESIRSIMLSKCLRTVEPFGGKICYDIEGKLVGTWFENNTNGYAGLSMSNYWVGHLVFAYDHIDPEAIEISLGSYLDTEKQFFVKGNSPDPANVSVGELVKYELVGRGYFSNGVEWNWNGYLPGIKAVIGVNVDGTLLVQLQSDRVLKVEAFPNKTASEVNGFTDNVRIYLR
jgi:hypothetical protein